MFRANLDREKRLEDWLAEDLSPIGLRALLIGRQVETPYGGRIDLLAIDESGDVIIIEIKRDRTARECVAQAIDYASWVNRLDANAIMAIYKSHMHGELAEAFHRQFAKPLPQQINSAHRLILLAQSLDEATRRLITYLVDECGVAANAASFHLYRLGEREILAVEWLIDPAKHQEQETEDEWNAWAGIWFVNVGPDPNINWEDNRRHGYIGARGGALSARGFFNIRVGDWFFAYRKAASGIRGYVGFGEVIAPPGLASETLIGGRSFFELGIDHSAFLRGADDPETAAYVLPVRWIKTFAETEARRFKGAFANQNIICKLTDAATLDFLRREFGG